jgi:hypothetical protein
LCLKNQEVVKISNFLAAAIKANGAFVINGRSRKLGSRKIKTLPFNPNQPNLHVRLLFRALALLKFSVFLQTAILIKKKVPKSIAYLKC